MVLWFLIRRITDEGTATRSIVLLAFAPSAFVLGMAYSEALLFLLAGVCLRALFAERWMVAGLAAAWRVRHDRTAWSWRRVALGRSRRLRRTRSLKPFVAPALAPLGIIAFFVFLQIRTGHFGAYVITQHRGWDQGFDAGLHTVRTLAGVVPHPLDNFNLLFSLLSVCAIVVAAAFMVHWRPPFVLVIYTVGILGLALTSTSLTSTPRFVMTAFPLTIAVARKVDGAAFGALLGVSASVMAGLLMISSLSILYTP